MARPREFDVEAAVEKAMHVFWDRGYEGAVLSDLLRAMGISRGSLYKAFKDKRSLFLAALAHYDRTEIEGAVRLLTEDEGSDGNRRIKQLLHGVVVAVAERNDRRGCFLCNAAVDQAPHDPEVTRMVLAMMGRLDRGFAVALRQSSGPQRGGAEIENVARSLTSAYMGLRVLAKAGYAPNRLADTVATVLYEAGVAGKNAKR